MNAVVNGHSNDLPIGHAVPNALEFGERSTNTEVEFSVYTLRELSIIQIKIASALLR